MGGDTPVNAYGNDWALQHNAGLTPAQAFVAIEPLNSDGSAANNIDEIRANAQPGWRPGANNTLFDHFAPGTVVATNQSPPANLVALADPAAAPANNPPVLAVIGARTVNENQLLSFTATATDPDAGQTLTFSGGGLPTGATLTAGVFSWTPSFAQAGNYNVTITVTDNGSPAASDSETFTITVGNVNRPPVLGAIGARTATAGTALTFTATATDPDANALTFSGGSLPTGATLNATTGVFTWTPTAAQTGSFPVTITVTDNGSPAAASDFETFTITVGAAANRPPVLGAIGARTVNENQALTFTATATDPDAGQALSFSGGGLPTGATLNATTGAFSWTPTFDQAGNHNVTITVTDNGSPAATDFETFTITVGNVNRPPVLAPIGAKTATAGTALAFTATATDPDGNALNFSATGLPTGATLNATTGAFSWTPTAAQTGPFPVTITVTDNGTPAVASDFEAFTITVGAAANRPPVLAPIGAKTATEGVVLQFTATASDPDGGTLTFSATGLPTGATLNATTGAFSWTPGFDQAGNHPVTIIVTDAGGQADSEAITISVGNVNRPPVLAPIGAKTVNVAQALNFTATASDPDGGALTFSATGLPTGATLSTAGAFSWTPTAAGTFPVTITVTDTGGTTDSEAFTITVGAAANRAPVVNPIGNRTVTAGNPLSFTITGSDPDGNALSFSAGTTLPGGATLNAATGAFSWTPTALQVSATPYTVTVTATDNGTPALTSTPVTFTITVSAPAVNRAPTVNNPGNRTVTEGQSLSFTITGSDPDAGNTLTFTATGLPTGAALSAGGAFSWTPATGQASATPYSVTVTATDNGNPAMTSTPVTFTITVNAPVVSPPPSASVRIGEAKWEDSRKLEVEGRVRPGGSRVMVTIVDADSGNTLATVRTNSEGKFEAELRLSAAPCKVQAKTGNASSAVMNVSRACGNRSDDD